MKLQNNGVEQGGALVSNILYVPLHIPGVLLPIYLARVVQSCLLRGITLCVLESIKLLKHTLRSST